MNIINIKEGLNKVQEQVNMVNDVAQFEFIPINKIHTADDNPYASNDTDESIKNLAESIRLSGLLHPLTVNKKGDIYQIISGERRFTAISKHLNWDSVPCMVYNGISEAEAQLRLHTANLEVREYTSGQKLIYYKQVENLVEKMINSGMYTGGKQKCISNILGISERQAQKYKKILNTLPKEKQKEITDGRVSINEAYSESQNILKANKGQSELVPIEEETEEKSSSKKQSKKHQKNSYVTVLRNVLEDLGYPIEEVIIIADMFSEKIKQTN